MRPEFFKGAGAEPLLLSTEEAAILADEIDQDAKMVEEILVGVNTVMDVQNVIEGGDPAGTAFANADILALSDIVNDMTGAVMGGVVIVDYTPTLEGFVEQAKSIYDKIVAMLKKVWEFIKNFFKRIFDYRNHLRGRVTSLREKIATLSNESVVEKPTINVPMTDGKIFTMTGKKLLDTTTFQVIMSDIFKNVKLNFEHGPVAINAVGTAFLNCLESFDPTDPHDSIQSAMADKVLPALWRYFDAFGIKDFKKNSVGGYSANKFTAVSQPLAGSCRVEFTWGKSMNEFFIDRKTDQKFAHVLQDLASAKSELIQDKPVDHSNNLTMPAFKFEGMRVALDKVEEGLKLIDALEINQKKNLTDFSEKFGKLASDVSNKFKPAANDTKPVADEEDPHSVYNALIRLPAAYTNMAHQPISDLTKRTLGTFEAVLNMVERSAKMYHPKAA